MRIAHVGTSDLSVRFILFNQLLGLKRAGFDVAAVCAPGPWAKELRDTEIPVFAVPMPREINVRLDVQALRALISLFRRERFSVVHTHTPKAGVLGPLAARLARVPHVVHTVHGFLFHDRMGPLRRAPFMAVEALTARLVDHLLFQARDDMTVARRLRIANPAKIHYQGNGVDLRRFDPAAISLDQRNALRHEWGFSAGTFAIGMVGRLVREKGYSELFAAAEALIYRYPQARFVIVGPEEPDQADAVDLTRDVPSVVRAYLRWLGMRLDMPRVYAAMDLLVLPSHREGLPRALLEGSAMMLPVIASDIRGCREVIVDGKTGVLVRPKDPRALAEAVGRMIENPARARAMGEAGRAHVQTSFDEVLVVERLINFYQEVLCSGERRALRDPARA